MVSCILTICRKDNVVRHADSPAKRYAVNDHPTILPIKRQQPQGTVSSIDPSVTPNPNGSEDGGVPAVGVGGDINTSLLPSLTDASVTSEAAAFATSGDADPNQAAQQTTVVTDVAANTTAEASAAQVTEATSTLPPTATAIDQGAAGVQQGSTVLLPSTTPIQPLRSRPTQMLARSSKAQLQSKSKPLLSRLLRKLQSQTQLLHRVQAPLSLTNSDQR